MALKLRSGDVHIVIGHSSHKAKVFDSKGFLLWSSDALTDGINDDVDTVGGDTPAGDYVATNIVQTLRTDTAADWRAYGPFFIGLYDLDAQERSRGRAGIGMHGGGTGLANPQEPMQPLIPTLGCIRWRNRVLSEQLVPLVKKTEAMGNSVYVTVVR